MVHKLILLLSQENILCPPAISDLIRLRNEKKIPLDHGNEKVNSEHLNVKEKRKITEINR